MAVPVTRRRRRFKIALIVVGSVVAVIAVIAFAVAYFVGGEFHENKAQDAVAPLEQRLEALGGQKLCSSGFSGYGVLNDTTQPWYVATYRVPNSTTAKKVFFAEASKLGYPLVLVERNLGNKLDEHFNSDPSGADTGLDLEILHNTKLFEGCDDYGDRTSAVSGKEAMFRIGSPNVHR